MERRTFLRSGLAAATLSLVGCSGDDSTATTTESDPAGPGTTADATTTTTGTPPETTTTTTPETTTTTAPDTTTTTTPETDTTTTTTTTTEADTTTTTTTTTTTATPEPAQLVEVFPDGEFRFGPESFTIQAGETVQWVWRGTGHNVVAESTPEGSDWTGTPGAPTRTFEEGYVYRYTFETTGDYSYFCNPHKSLDMEGSFTVE